MHYVLPGKKTQNTTSAAPKMLKLVSKIQKIIKCFHKSANFTGAAKMGEKVFFSQSENHFLHIPADILVSFPVILLFWSLSLSPVWLNIEGQQDFSY